MNRFWPSASLIVALLLALPAAAGDRGARDERGVLLPIAGAPIAERSRENPYRGDPAALAAGAKLFRQHCAACHGTDGAGSNRATNLSSAGVQNATPGELAWFLRNGNLAGGMPSWSRLPEERRWQLVTYLGSLR